MEKKVKTEDLLLESRNFFEFYKKEVGRAARVGGNIIYVDFNNVSSFSPILSETLISNPEEILMIMETSLEESGLIKNPRIRLINLPESHSEKIRNLRAKHLNYLIQVEGIVRQASEVRPQVVNARFECPSCGTIISILQIESKFREPSRCSCGRRGGFKLLTKDMVDAQRLVIEESPENLTGGEQPRRISVFLKEDLVEPKMEEKTTPGSKLRVLGVLKEVTKHTAAGGQLTRYDIAIEANNLIPLEETYEEVEIDEEDETQIKELAADPRLFEKLTESIAPSIYGYSEVKQALVLQLFGGVKKERSDGTQTRGDFHVLLVGDPGVAKSVILTFISASAPKGRYVVGRSASGAGITATVVRDEFLRGWSLEAGAMVLANKGIVCIDEMDKMDPQDRSAMHEAMEQQCMLPDFDLMLSDGKYVKIGSFVDNLMNKNKNQVYEGKDCEILPVKDVELISTDFSNHFPMKASRISRHLAPNKFFKITLTNGREITVTPEHPCWVVKEGRLSTIPAEKLTKDMYFPVPSKIKIKSKPYKKENDDLCKILGYHISDGCYELNRGKKTGIQFWNNDELLIKDYKQVIERFFKIKTIVTKRKNQFAVRVISKKVVEKIKEIDKNLLEKGPLKSIPSEVMKLPKENIRYLLRALYDGDGSVVFQNRGGCRISFVSQNRRLEDQMSDLLLRFGIQSSIFEDKHSNVWRLDISGQDNLSKFLIKISFLSQKKKQRLKSYCGKTKTYRTIRDLIPGCTDEISKIFKKLKISSRKEIGHSIDLHVEKQRKFLQRLVLIAEKKLSELGDNKKTDKIIKDLEEIKKLAFGYSRWVKIKEVSEIKNKGIKWVYDVTMEPHHTFISNGMVLHNSVTVSKATVQAKLRAETSVLAAANPKFGRFDPYQTVGAQIDLPPTLINRFDIIFILKDIPEREKDSAIATHVLLESKEIKERNIIERSLFRKYIAYARQRIKPKLTEGAIEEIKKFYVDLRNMPTTSDQPTKPLPISARQLEGLIRLSEASAKVRLSNKATRDDAKRAIELMKYYLMKVGYDYETKTFDIDRIATGVTTSQRGKILAVREALNKLEGRLGKLIPLEEIKKELAGKVPEEDIDKALEKLTRSGDIFHPRKGFIQKM